MTKPATLTTRPSRVFALHGAEPEVQAYAMAKYSRSSLSMGEAITEINSQKAEQFLNTFYFQYGHKSIADLAHIPLAIENISLLAAIEVTDEQRWDGQERSTRYQDFSKREVYYPTDLNEVEAAHYSNTINMLFDAYNEVLAEVEEVFYINNPKPEGMDSAAHKRTIRARAFDVARYLLPMATMTSVGQITSARTLESQISRMLASPYAEVRDLGERIKNAATKEPSFNVNDIDFNDAIDDISGKLTDTETLDLRQAVVKQIVAAPTLVKYAEANNFKIESDKIAKRILATLRLNDETKPEAIATVEYKSYETELEILSTLLYEHSDQPLVTIRKALSSRTQEWRSYALNELLTVRGRHDELLRGYRADCGTTFDLTMDIGGMRDMHRHRRCNQTLQPYTPNLGFAMPEPFVSAKVNQIYTAATAKAKHAFEIMRQLRVMRGVETGPEAYLLPLGTNCRFLMKMDVAEMAYISELRTGPAGHISYRRVAWQIYQALRSIAPTLAASIENRVTDPDTPLDFFKR